MRISLSLGDFSSRERRELALDAIIRIEATPFAGHGLSAVPSDRMPHNLYACLWVEMVIAGLGMALSLTLPKRLEKGLIFPLRLALHAVLNGMTVLLDSIDGTRRYFHNSLLVLSRAGT
jgi:hypothetical protein